MKRVHNFLNDLFDKIDVKNFGYKVNKWIFRIFFIIMLLWLFLVGYVDGASSMVGDSWYECPADAVTPCYNPLYNVFCFESYCRDDVILQGEIVWGSKPSWWAIHFADVLTFGFVGCLLLNHFLYNRGFKVKKFEK